MKIEDAKRILAMTTGKYSAEFAQTIEQVLRSVMREAYLDGVADGKAEAALLAKLNPPAPGPLRYSKFVHAGKGMKK